MNKICKTNPIFEMPKINITDYMTNSYSNNSQVLEMQKRTQSNPILACHKGCKAKSKPILPAYDKQGDVRNEIEHHPQHFIERNKGI
jgi:hypothetical protein